MGPDLIKLPSEPFGEGRKYHFRTYVLINNEQDGTINGYRDKDAICYMAYSPYKKDKFTEDVMLTNLDAARRTAINNKEPIDNLAEKFVCNFFDHYKGDKEELYKKLDNLCRLTVQGYRKQIKCRNRKVNKFLGCFHILAYDLMIPEDNELYILGVNTSPGWKGPRRIWGGDALTSFYDDVFKLTIDKEVKAYKEPRIDNSKNGFIQVFSTNK